MEMNEGFGLEYFVQPSSKNMQTKKPSLMNAEDDESVVNDKIVNSHTQFFFSIVN